MIYVCGESNNPYPGTESLSLALKVRVDARRPIGIAGFLDLHAVLHRIFSQHRIYYQSLIGDGILSIFS